MTITSITPLLTPGATVVAAPYAPAGPIIAGTSQTPNNISVGGSYVFVVDQVGLGFVPGVRVRAAAVDDVTQWIEGICTAFDGINLTIVSDLSAGFGVHPGWNLNVTGQPGKTGQIGAPGPQGPPGTAAIPNDAFLPGKPTAPTPLQGDNSLSIATTQFVTTAVQFVKIDTVLTGSPTAPTPPPGDNSTKIANTAFVQNTIGTNYAPINSPTFTGTPHAPTPVAGSNDTSLATTAFVTGSFAPLNNPVFIGNPKAPTPLAGDNTTSIATTAYVMTAAVTLAPIASPHFTGTPSAVTPGPTDNSTSIATTAFVKTAILPLAPLIAPAFQSSGTTNPTSPTPGPTSFDSSIATTAFVKTAIAPLATLQSPTFTGSPQAPTQQQGTFDSSLATTAYVMTLVAGYQPLSSELTSLSGVTSSGAFYYRSAPGTWLPVEMGANMTFSSGILSSAGGGGGTGGIAEAPTDGVYYSRRNATWIGTAIQTDAPSDGVNYVRLNATWANINTALAAYAPINNPVFTGNARAVTPASADNTTSIATTAFVKTVLGPYAPLASPPLSGVPTAPTPAAISNDGTLATTAFVQSAVAPLAPIANPNFTGTPQAPTPPAGHNDTGIATTAFVTSAIGAIPGIPDASITYAKIQNISATSRVLGRIAAGAGVTQELAGGDLVTIIDGNLTSLMAPGNWNIFYSNGSGVRTALPVGAAGTSLMGNGATVAPSFTAWGTAAQFAANSANAVLATNAVWTAAAPVTLTDAATVTPDFSTGFDFIWTLGATGRTLANPTNMKLGQKGVIYLIEDATGSRTITTWGTNYKFSGGTKPTLTTTAAAVDVVSYCVKSATEIECFFSGDMR